MNRVLATTAAILALGAVHSAVALPMFFEGSPAPQSPVFGDTEVVVPSAVSGAENPANRLIDNTKTVQDRAVDVLQPLLFEDTIVGTEPGQGGVSAVTGFAPRSGPRNPAAYVVASSMGLSFNFVRTGGPGLAVPEPATTLLLLVGIAGILAAKRSK